MTARVPIAVQVAEVERELVMRDRVYPRLVAGGQLMDHEARERIRDLQAALATLRTVQRHADGLRRLVAWLQAVDLDPGETPASDELEGLRRHPAVAALLEAFPGADLRDAGPVQVPAPDPAQDDLFEDA